MGYDELRPIWNYIWSFSPYGEEPQIQVQVQQVKRSTQIMMSDYYSNLGDD